MCADHDQVASGRSGGVQDFLIGGSGGPNMSDPGVALGPRNRGADLFQRLLCAFCRLVMVLCFEEAADKGFP